MKYNEIVDNEKLCHYNDEIINIKDMCNDCFFYNDCYIDNDVKIVKKSRWL